MYTVHHKDVLFILCFYFFAFLVFYVAYPMVWLFRQDVAFYIFIHWNTPLLSSPLLSFKIIFICVLLTVLLCHFIKNKDPSQHNNPHPLKSSNTPFFVVVILLYHIKWLHLYFADKQITAHTTCPQFSKKNKRLISHLDYLNRKSKGHTLRFNHRNLFFFLQTEIKISEK